MADPKIASKKPIVVEMEPAHIGGVLVDTQLNNHFVMDHIMVQNFLLCQ